MAQMHPSEIEGLTKAISTPPVDARREGRSWDWSQVLASPLMLPLILVITFAVFAPTLNDWFQADDFWLLRSSQTTPIGKFITQAFDYRDARPVPQFGFYRPLYIITFRLCYAVFGLHAVAYHALNIALHLGSVVLVWLIARRLLQSIFAANVSAAIFALHPAYTESVEWIARGNTVMVTFVYLFTILAFMNYVDGGRRRYIYYIASVSGFVASVLYHTTALSLVGVLPAYVFLVSGRPADALRLRSWLWFVPFFAIALVMLLIQTSSKVNVQGAFPIGWHQYSAYGKYLGLTLFPVLHEDWLRLHLPKIAPLYRLQLPASLAMIGATLVLLDRREWPYRGVFVVWWLYVALLPNTTALLGVIPAQLYLPGASVGMFFVLVVRRMNEILPAQFLRRALRLAPLVLMALLASAALLGVDHARALNKWQDRSFIVRLRETVPRMPPGSTLYVVDPPFNLVVFNDDALDAAVELYYGDVTVHRISDAEAAWIRVADPAALIFDNRLPSQP